MKITTHYLKESLELIPSIYFWWHKGNKGVAFGWLCWALEIRDN